MKIIGALNKMITRHDSPVAYSLELGGDLIDMNNLVGKRISLEFKGEIFCIGCGRKTRKSFSQGFCYPCFRSKAACDRCIMSPELCHFDAGTCREPEWAEQHCMQPHVVYVANASGLKVGITRGTQVPTRWMDQGAIQAMPVLQVKTRRESGLIESCFKDFMKDRTDWRRMLKNAVEPVDLAQAWRTLCEQQGLELESIRRNSGAKSAEWVEQGVYNFDYPVIEYPQKVTALNLDKNPSVGGVLKGIKGQYLILDCGVLNVRKFGGYQVALAA